MWPPREAEGTGTVLPDPGLSLQDCRCSRAADVTEVSLSPGTPVHRVLIPGDSQRTWVSWRHPDTLLPAVGTCGRPCGRGRRRHGVGPPGAHLFLCSAVPGQMFECVLGVRYHGGHTGPPRTPQGAGRDASTVRGSSEVTYDTRKAQHTDGNAAECRVAGETPDRGGAPGTGQGWRGRPQSFSETGGQSPGHEHLPCDGGDVPAPAGTHSHSLAPPSEGST